MLEGLRKAGWRHASEQSETPAGFRLARFDYAPHSGATSPAEARCSQKWLSVLCFALELQACNLVACTLTDDKGTAALSR